MQGRAILFAFILFFLPGCLSRWGQCDFADAHPVEPGETFRMRGRTISAGLEAEQEAFTLLPPLVVKYCNADDHNPHVSVWIRGAAPTHVAISNLKEDDRVFLSGSGKTLTVEGYETTITLDGRQNVVYTSGVGLLIVCTSSAYDNRIIQLDSRGIGISQHGEGHRNTLERFGP